MQAFLTCSSSSTNYHSFPIPSPGDRMDGIYSWGIRAIHYLSVINVSSHFSREEFFNSIRIEELAEISEECIITYF